jgi:hypothetical protein
MVARQLLEKAVAKTEGVAEKLGVDTIEGANRFLKKTHHRRKAK